MIEVDQVAVRNSQVSSQSQLSFETRMFLCLAVIILLLLLYTLVLRHFCSCNFSFWSVMAFMG